jgi:eukaryotic-like serine/threonine-protein kinase
MHVAPQRIGPYPIERELGRGGMGVVYLGRDPALGRPVAVKVLPLEVARDPQRLSRFDREARTLAAVHHANVASIFGVGEDDEGHRFLALEYVPGESLAERLARSSLAPSEALRVCAQIAAGLEAAHEAGVVHRDLKPANVRITPDGTAKLLDFGLAKGDPAGSASGDAMASIHLGSFASTEGIVLGTLTYMSPEQASGKAVDRRTDVWALGCILFESLAGGAPFAGNTPTDVMVKVLDREPPWERLPPQTPRRVLELLRRCLEKDKNRRLRDAGDARLEIEAALLELGSASEVTVVLARSRRRRLGFVAAGAALALAAGALGWWSGRRQAPWPAAPLHLQLAVPRSLRAVLWTLTHDGSSVLFWARPRAAESGPLRLYRRRLDAPEVTEVAGSEGVHLIALSPDGRWLYVARTSGAAPRLLRIPVDGSGPPLEVAEWEPDWTGLVVLGGGDLLAVVGNGSRLIRLDGSSGKPGSPIAVDLAGVNWLRTSLGSPLPDGRILFDAGRWGERGLEIGTLLVDPTNGRTQRVLDDGHQARYVTPDLLLFARGTVLLGAPFDARAGRLSGEPVALTGDVFAVNGADWDLGGNGTLVYRLGARAGAERRLVAVTPGADGVVPWSPERREYLNLSTSPDGEWAYTGILDARQVTEIWRIPRGGAGERLWSDRRADVRWPLPSPDGRWLAFTRRGGDRGNGVYLLDLQRRAEPRLLRAFRSTNEQVRALSWLPDSSRLLVAQRQDGGHAILELDVIAGGAAVPMRELMAPPAEHAAVSPDGRWIAFARTGAGDAGVYVAPYRRDGALEPGRALSGAEGREPRWSPDGRTLYYAEGEDRVFGLPMRGGAAGGEPRLALSLGDPLGFVSFGQRFDVLPDGRLLLVERGEEEGELRQLELVLGFGGDLARRLRR